MEDEFVGFKENVEEKEVLNSQNSSCLRKNKICIIISISIFF
jgi:hypothetical protein